MELVGEPRASAACNLLGVPGVSSLDADDDEGEVEIGIRPKSSPLPRRRSSVSDEDSEPEPPLCGSRRVSFADAKGLSLVQVKEFDTWDLSMLPGYDSLEGEGNDAEEYYLSPLFPFLLSSGELLFKVREQKVELETIELLPGTTTLKGLIRVLNVSFDKAVYVRTTLDAWSSHFDLLAEYIPGSSDGVTDCFSFKLILVPPFGEQGARVDFCLRYETPVGTFWANNDNRNYVLFCHQREKKRENPRRENGCRKSCLKVVCQNLPTVENVSSQETLPSQENGSAGASNHGEDAVSMNALQISDSQSGPSEDGGQKSLIESSRNSGRRSRRRAARLARVRDYFAQRDGQPNDTESEVASWAAREETPLEARSNVSGTQSVSEERSKSGALPVGSEPLGTTNKTSPGVRYQTPPARDSTAVDKSEKPESIYLADSVTLKMVGKDATDIPNNPLHPNDKPAPTKHRTINKPVSKAEDDRQRRQVESSGEGVDDESASRTADESDGSVIHEGLVSQANSFMFGTVVAPLYRQVFGRVGGEGQDMADRGNPMVGRLNMGYSSPTQNDPYTERRESSSSVSADVSGNHAKVLGASIKTQESDPSCKDVTLNHPIAKRRETSLNVSADAIQESDRSCAETPEEPKRFLLLEETVHPRSRDILSAGVLNTRVPRESLHPQGKSQEVNLTHGLRHNSLVQKQTIAETAPAQPAEDLCSQGKTLQDTILPRPRAQADTTGIQPSSSPPPLSPIVSVRVGAETDKRINRDCGCVEDDDIGTTSISTTTNAYSEQDKASDAQRDLDPNCINDSTTTEADNSAAGDDDTPVSSVGVVEERLVENGLNTTHETSPGTAKEANDVEGRNEVTDNTDNSGEDEIKQDVGGVAESMPRATTSSYHTHADMFVEIKEEKPVDMSEKEEHRGIKAIVTKMEGINPGLNTKEQNWEIMVEEEEETILIDEEGSEEINTKEEDLEAVVKVEGEVMEEHLVDMGIGKIEVEFEGMEEEEKIIVEEMEEESAAAEEDEDTAGIDDKEMVEEEEMEETLAVEEKDIAGKELEDGVDAMQKEKVVEEEMEQEIVVGEEEDEVETDFEEEEDILEVDVHGEEIQEEKEIDGDEKMDIDMDEEDEIGVEWEDEEKPQEENMDEEISDDEEQMLDDEAADAEFISSDADGTAVEEREDEDGGLEERSDMIQNKVEDDLSTPGNNVHEGVDERVIDKENTEEGEKPRGPTELHLSPEDDDRSDAPRDRSKAAAEGAACILTDEPESDGNSSTESLSDDEVQLYMHCLRAVQGQHSLARASRDCNARPGFSVGKRPSIGRGKQLPSPMPCISESVDEEQRPSSLQDNQEDVETEDAQPTGARRPAASGQRSVNRKTAWWKETMSSSNVSKTLLYTTLLVLFLVAAYHYDFLACFGLYLISVFWLCCQGETQPVKNNNRIG